MSEDVKKEDATQDNTEGASGEGEVKGDETPKGGDADTTDTEPEGGEVKTDVKAVEITLKLPDGSLLTPADIERHTTHAKENGLSQEAAQELLDRDHNTVKSFHEVQKKQLDDMRKVWVKEIQDDPVYGGKDAKKNQEIAKRGVQYIGKQIGKSNELEQILNLTGLGENPVFIRMFHHIGKVIANDTFVHSKEKIDDTENQPRYRKFYPDIDNKKEE